MKAGLPSFLFLITTWILTLLLVSPGFTAEGDLHPSPAVGEFLLEHAEFSRQPDGRYQAYVTIWNGTDQEKLITSVTIDGFRNLVFARKTTDGLKEAEVNTANVFVPGKSELHMDAETLFVVMERETNVAPKLSVVFNDGRTLSGTVTALAPSQGPTDHRHGWRPKQ